MIRQYSASPTTFVTNYIYLDLYDKYAFALGTPSFSFSPLIKIKSQETNQEKIFIATTVDTTHAQRYFRLSWVALNTDADVPIVGLIYLGTKDFPYGVYDIFIYENSSSSNLDPVSAYRTIYMGLMYLQSTTNNSTEWTEYESTTQQEVYITNPFV
jgi:hypothetical protein